MLGTVFVLSLGFLYGGEANPIGLAQTRFSHPLPPDNYLPLYFAEGLFRSPSFHAPPAFADWLSSDRPPLQVGYVVAAMPLGWSASGIRYQVLAVALQQLWILGAWSLLAAFAVRPRTRALVLVSVLVGDIAIVHGFFVWPKLLPVGFLLAACGIVFGADWPTSARRAPTCAILGMLLGAALLCHGASVYAVIPLVVAAVWRARPSRRSVAALVLVVGLFQLPWMAYQQFVDPPGDRLQKWMLAGQVDVSDESLPSAVANAYLHTDFGDIVQLKLDNLEMVTGGIRGVRAMWHAARLVLTGDFQQGIEQARYRRFLHLLPNVGLPLLGLIVMAVASVRRLARDDAEWTFALRVLTYLAPAILLWTILQYGNWPSITVVHTGSFLFPVLAVVGLVVGTAAVSQRLATVLVATNCALVLTLYVPMFDPLRPSTVSPLFAIAGVAAVVLFGLGAFALPMGGISGGLLDVDDGSNDVRAT
jgi:hypothetical protein